MLGNNSLSTRSVIALVQSPQVTNFSHLGHQQSLPADGRWAPMWQCCTYNTGAGNSHLFHGWRTSGKLPRLGDFLQLGCPSIGTKLPDLHPLCWMHSTIRYDASAFFLSNQGGLLLLCHGWPASCCNLHTLTIYSTLKALISIALVFNALLTADTILMPMRSTLAASPNRNHA